MEQTISYNSNTVTGPAFKSQRLAYPYFAVAAILFLLQVISGLWIGAQYIWPTLWMNTLPFNLGREVHLNLMVFWLLLGLMGASYYLIPEETKTEIFNVRLAWIQLGILILAGLGTLFSFFVLQQSQGRPITEAPMPWPIFIAIGVILFLVNIGMTIVRSNRYTPTAVILAVGMVLLAVFYMLNFVSFSNLTVDYYWWWWIIHLWVEGAWELIAAAITAFLLVKITGVELHRMNKWLYVEVALVMFTGIIGIGHHYYWIGTPPFWLYWGAAFSALEPVPIVLMTWDALSNLSRQKTKPANRVAWYMLGGMAILHFLGAGVWGLAMTLPQINKWTHGTQITAAHGHFAFFGAFVLLVLAAVYYIVPKLQGVIQIREGRGMWAFWLMVSGMVGMVASLTFAGVIQVYLNRMLGMDFIQVRDQYIKFWQTARWVSGLGLFLPGTIIYLWDFFKAGTKVKASAGHPTIDT